MKRPFRILEKGVDEIARKNLDFQIRSDSRDEMGQLCDTFDRMGDGDDELGRILMKSFLFAVTQLDQLPETILFYNGGAKLTVEGSESLEDLKKMEEQGTVIMTCGTCLDFYGIKDKLAVGTVTNMYSIVETLQNAGKVIRP